MKKKKYTPKFKLRDKVKFLEGRFSKEGKPTCPSCSSVLSPYMYMASEGYYLFFKCGCSKVVRICYSSR